MTDLVGIWGCDLISGPEVRGELLLERSGPRWRAFAAGEEVAALFRPANRVISFNLPAARGAFRGLLADDGASIAGFWIQQRGIIGGHAYATPLALEAVGAGSWRGEIVPLDERIELYLAVQRDPDGGLSSFLRDPERNEGLFLRLAGISLHGAEVRLESRSHGEIVGTYDEQNDNLSIALPGYPLPLELTRRDEHNAPGFYPRTPPVDRYEYRQPTAEDDGWQTASLADEGFDPRPIAALVEHILRTATTGVATPYVHSILIARHGWLVLEEYFYGFERDRPHDLRSATKSLTAALVGAAIDRIDGFDLTTPVYPLFSAYPAFAHDDPRKQSITVEHLLTMTSGLACDDDDEASPGNEDVMQAQAGQPDWYKYTLDLPLAREPGERAVYCSAGMNLLGGAIARATRRWLPDFFHQHFALPLGFGRYHLQLTPGNELYCGGGSYMRPRDFMKLGQLYLDAGRWSGRQVLSRAWVERSLQPHAGLHGPDDFGYGWHLAEYHVAGQTYRTASAAGNGGQLLILVPALDLLVMFTAANYGNYPTWSKFRDDLVPRFIIPALAG